MFATDAVDGDDGESVSACSFNAGSRQHGRGIEQEMDRGRSCDHSEIIRGLENNPVVYFYSSLTECFDPLSVGLQSRRLKKPTREARIRRDGTGPALFFLHLSSFPLQNPGDGNALWFGLRCHSVLHDGARPRRACRVT